MNRETRGLLRVAKQMLGKPARPKNDHQQLESQAKARLRPEVNKVLAAEHAQFSDRVQIYNGAANPLINRLTIEILIQSLLRKDQTIVARATSWLAAIGASALAGLNLKLLKGRNPKLGVAAAEALGRISRTLSERERGLLMLKLDAAASQTRYPEVRVACVEAIYKIKKSN